MAKQSELELWLSLFNAETADKYEIITKLSAQLAEAGRSGDHYK